MAASSLRLSSAVVSIEWTEDDLEFDLDGGEVDWPDGEDLCDGWRLLCVSGGSGGGGMESLPGSGEMKVPSAGLGESKME